MPRRFPLALALLGAALLSPVLARASADACVECHSKQSPGIVGDWKISKHSASGVDCTACHGEAHKDATDAAKAASGVGSVNKARPQPRTLATASAIGPLRCAGVRAQAPWPIQ